MRQKFLIVLIFIIVGFVIYYNCFTTPKIDLDRIVDQVLRDTAHFQIPGTSTENYGSESPLHIVTPEFAEAINSIRNPTHCRLIPSDVVLSDNVDLVFVSLQDSQGNRICSFSTSQFKLIVIYNIAGIPEGYQMISLKTSSIKCDQFFRSFFHSQKGIMDPPESMIVE